MKLQVDETDDEQSLVITVKCKWCSEEFNLRDVSVHEKECKTKLNSYLAKSTLQ